MLEFSLDFYFDRCSYANMTNDAVGKKPYEKITVYCDVVNVVNNILKRLMTTCYQIIRLFYLMENQMESPGSLWLERVKNIPAYEY